MNLSVSHLSVQPGCLHKHSISTAGLLLNWNASLNVIAKISTPMHQYELHQHNAFGFSFKARYNKTPVIREDIKCPDKSDNSFSMHPGCIC